MSRVLLVCARETSPQRGPALSAMAIAALAERLTPDNILVTPAKVVQNGSTSIAVFSPVDALPLSHGSVCLGHMLHAKSDWWKPGADAPDGAFALFRSDESGVEVLSDALASRSIWYVQTPEFFIASTSQRAIVHILGSFEPNRETVSWMLFSGTLGYGLSWDRRIKWLEGGATLRLDRATWTTTLTSDPVEFRPVEGDLRDFEDRLKTALDSVFDNLGLDSAKWVLPLSGGYDSRTILMMLRNRAGLQCITWGLSGAADDPEGDAYIARAVARDVGVGHEYWTTDPSPESLETLFSRFLVAGEGRFDQIAGYMDGFTIWKHLHERGVEGIIRGDEPFGIADSAVCDALGARSYSDCYLASDYGNIDPAVEHYGLEPQVFPSALVRAEDETLPTWRDRLYQLYRVGTGNSAMNDLKCAYVEIANPFLSKRIVHEVRRMPDGIRDDKKVFKNLARSLSPPIPFARREATAAHWALFRSSAFVDCIRSEFGTPQTGGALPAEIVGLMLANIGESLAFAGPRLASLRAAGKRMIPDAWRARLRRRLLRKSLDYNVLAWRGWIVSRMHKLLSDDAAVSRAGKIVG